MSLPQSNATPCQGIGKNHGGPARAGVGFLPGERNEVVLSEIPHIQFHLGEPQTLSGFWFWQWSLSFLNFLLLPLFFASHLFALTLVPGLLPKLRSISEVPHWRRRRPGWIQMQLAAASTSSGRHRAWIRDKGREKRVTGEAKLNIY